MLCHLNLLTKLKWQSIRKRFDENAAAVTYPFKLTTTEKATSDSVRILTACIREGFNHLNVLATNLILQLVISDPAHSVRDRRVVYQRYLFSLPAGHVTVHCVVAH